MISKTKWSDRQHPRTSLLLKLFRHPWKFLHQFLWKLETLHCFHQYPGYPPPLGLSQIYRYPMHDSDVFGYFIANLILFLVTLQLLVKVRNKVIDLLDCSILWIFLINNPGFELLFLSD